MGPIEKACLDAENNRKSKSINESKEISPRIQLFLDKCARIITILKDWEGTELAQKDWVEIKEIIKSIEPLTLNLLNK